MRILLNAAGEGLDDGVARAADDGRIQLDLLVLSTGLASYPVFRRSGLATGEDGGMWVDRYLRSVTDERIFGGGRRRLLLG